MTVNKTSVDEGANGARAGMSGPAEAGKDAGIITTSRT